MASFNGIHGMPYHFRDTLRDELLKSKSPDQFLSNFHSRFNLDIDHLKIERNKTQEFMRQKLMHVETDKMAIGYPPGMIRPDYKRIGSLNPNLRDIATRVIINKFPEIYENSRYHKEFDDRFEHELNLGRHPEEAAYRAASAMLQKNNDLKRERMARDYQRDNRANPYRGESACEMHHRMDEAREKLRQRQIMMSGRNDHVLDALSLAVGCKPQVKKPLNFLEQLQSDVDVWLKDALKLTHLEGIKL